MFSQLFKKFTNEFTEVPLFYTVLVADKKEGEEAKATLVTKVHPTLQADDIVSKQLKSLKEEVQAYSQSLIHNEKDTPLFSVSFNLKSFQENGEKGSCNLKLHPAIKDESIINQLNGLVDYIRQNYDMENLSK